MKKIVANIYEGHIDYCEDCLEVEYLKIDGDDDITIVYREEDEEEKIGS